MLAEQEYPSSVGILTVMLSVKLRVEEETKMVKDLIQMIYNQCEREMKAAN